MNTTIDKQFTSEDKYIAVGEDQLYVKRYIPSTPKEAILMVHGSIEGGRIFYSLNDKGIAPYLAAQGFDVFVPDFRGRGKSRPLVSRNSKSRQIDAIEEEIPAIITEIKQYYPEGISIHIIAHSWGGVWTLAHLARHPELNIASMCFFATKRSISLKTFKKRFEVDFIWRYVAGLATKIFGYFPAKEMRIGQENEPKGVYEDCKKWVFDLDNWVDPSDNFNYLNAFKRASHIPPTLYLTGKREYYLGHKYDVIRLMKEVGNKKDKFIYLAKETGHAKDYDHINICTAKEAVTDHFPIIRDWLINKGE
ncbi:alpha/beta fold hydrolase [Flammeovirga kamogawensis]|uniref:Alpha/beta fold hydrolase n=1 Tax=Flammeovirga kamogawensis TaxID=373891 RepID=A0ABX8H0K1_9BACT|nr:alpha/beta fold hydrolase [Flammeovirga kamogawensis]MBB6459438.1 putative alpha/beta hydrolase [Flammeovirga kamogawensis]QWG08991.1 alpha/beta fold hydrolase [Flammeovirga kamogawensis]